MSRQNRVDNLSDSGVIDHLIRKLIADLTEDPALNLLPSFYLQILSKKVEEFKATRDLSVNQDQIIQVSEDLITDLGVVLDRQSILDYQERQNFMDQQRIEYICNCQMVQDARDYVQISLELIEQLFQGLPIAKFIKDKLTGDMVTIPFNEYYKLRAYNEFDKDLLVSIMAKCLRLDADTMLKTVDSFMRVNYFSVY